MGWTHHEMAGALAHSGETVLSAQGLACLRGLRLLFRDLSFEARGGQIVLLRGPNGSGKTSLLRQLAGLLRPDAGRVVLSGVPGEGVHFHGHLDGLKPFETPREALKRAGALAGLSLSAQAVSDGLERMGLTRPADVPVRFLSAGQRRRTALARLVLVPRPVWLMDEPFASLDGAGQTLCEGLISAHVAGGGLVVASLHGETALRPDVTLDLSVASTGAVAA